MKVPFEDAAREAAQLVVGQIDLSEAVRGRIKDCFV